jgi:hypothetical protein
MQRDRSGEMSSYGSAETAPGHRTAYCYEYCKQDQERALEIVLELSAARAGGMDPDAGGAIARFGRTCRESESRL